jgi:hypothetical protein
MKFYPAIILLFILSFPLSAHSINCKDLDSNEKIINFVKKAQDSNPLLRKNCSAKIEIIPCQGKGCLKKNRKKLKETLHLVKMNNSSRIFSLKGPNARQCVVSRQDRQFLCLECDMQSNNQCRSYNSEDTLIRGTNIDLNDFKWLIAADQQSECKEIPDKPGYFKIITTPAQITTYGKAISFYDKKKEVLVTCNFFSDQILRKVYRFFPKYYKKIDNVWISTAARVRTTQGSEKKYIYETLIRVIKGANKIIYLDPKKDPQLKGINYNVLFSTN